MEILFIMLAIAVIVTAIVEKLQAKKEQK